jgi:hypothetical protein
MRKFVYFLKLLVIVPILRIIDEKMGKAEGGEPKGNLNGLAAHARFSDVRRK